MNFSYYVSVLLKIDRLNEQIERLESNLYYVHPSTLTDMPRGSLVGTDGVTDDIYKLHELRDQRLKLREERDNIRIAVGMTDVEFAIVFQKYVLNMTWKEIAKEHGYSARHVQRIHSELMEKFRN